MHTYSQTYIYTYTYIYTCTYTRIHAHTYTYACICTHMYRWKILTTTLQRVKQYYRRTYASICKCMHIHTYIRIHICAQPAANVFADVYVGVKLRLFNIHTYTPTHALVPKTPVPKCMQHSLQKKCTHVHTYTHMHTHTYAHEHTCACMTPSTR